MNYYSHHQQFLLIISTILNSINVPSLSFAFTIHYHYDVHNAGIKNNAIDASYLKRHWFSNTKTKLHSTVTDYTGITVSNDIRINQEEEYLDPAGPSIDLLNLSYDEHLSYFHNRHNGEGDPNATIQDTPWNKSTFQVTKISSSPHIFLFQNLLSTEECQSLIHLIKNDNDDENNDIDKVEMSSAEITEGDTKMRSNCNIAWIPNDNSVSNLPLHLGRIVGNILMTDEAKRNGWCEDLQLVHYKGKGGRFDLHYDGLYRSITVIYYLNGVGNTWFPFALSPSDEGDKKKNNCDDESLGHNMNIPSNRDEAVQMVEKLGLQPGKDGIIAAGTNSKIWNENYDSAHVVKVNCGDAIAFFNYKTNNVCDYINVESDWRSIHAGLPTTEEEGDKWIANHWIHHLPFRKDWVVVEKVNQQNKNY